MIEMNIRLREDVENALRAERAIVALESTVITHGLPYPHNLETARELERVVRDGGALPATIGVLGGTPVVGLNGSELEHFAQGTALRKLSRRDLGVAIAGGHDGATTVAATMALAAIAGIAV